MEGVGFGCLGREPLERESGLVGGAADVAIGHSYLFGGGSEDRELGGAAVFLVDVMAVGPGVIGDSWDVIDGEVSDEGLAVEADMVGLEERVRGTAEGSGESITGIATILEDGRWFSWREPMVDVYGGTLFGLVVLGLVGSDVFGPGDVLI